MRITLFFKNFFSFFSQFELDQTHTRGTGGKRWNRNRITIATCRGEDEANVAKILH